VSGPWVGIDPGSVATGIAVRNGNRLLWHAVVERTSDEDVVRGIGVGAKYIHAVLDAIDLAIDNTDPAGIAVEGIVRPNPHVRRKDGSSLIDAGTVAATAMVLGGILAVRPDAVIVPPKSHGHNDLWTYPEALVTPGEARRGLRRKAQDNVLIHHCRCAFDVAGKGQQHAALRSARRPTTGATSA
jgi:hypothetical protein